MCQWGVEKMNSLEIVNNLMIDLKVPKNSDMYLYGYETVISKEEVKTIKQDLIFAEELKKFIKDFELPKSLYLIGYLQARIREKDGDFNE